MQHARHASNAPCGCIIPPETQVGDDPNSHLQHDRMRNTLTSLVALLAVSLFAFSAFA